VKLKKIISKLVTGVLVFVFALMILTVLASRMSGVEPTILGYQIKTVLSGSMEPEIMTGSIVVLEPGGDMSRFEKGDVITFLDSEERLITHRVHEVVNPNGNVLYRTMGDNNDAPDMELVQPINVVAYYSGITVPYIGYAFVFASSKMGNLLLMIIPGLLLVIYASITSWKMLSVIEKKNYEEKTMTDNT
jgi:signal peptidase